MCILCNLTDPATGMVEASDFLSHFGAAGAMMKRAEADLLATSAHVKPDVARRYRAVQKKMARLRREWNCIEHEREVADTTDR